MNQNPLEIIEGDDDNLSAGGKISYVTNDKFDTELLKIQEIIKDINIKYSKFSSLYIDMSVLSKKIEKQDNIVYFGFIILAVTVVAIVCDVIVSRNSSLEDFNRNLDYLRTQEILKISNEIILKQQVKQ